MSRRTYTAVLVLALIFAAVCSCVAFFDEKSMDYSDADLDGYVPSVGDRVIYLVNDNGTEYYLVLTVVSLPDGNGDYTCDLLKHPIDNPYDREEKHNVTVPASILYGDPTELGHPLTLKKTKSTVQTTEYAKLTCTRDKFNGSFDGFRTVLDILGLSSAEHISDSGTAVLRIYDYQGHLFDYVLKVTYGDGSVYNLKFSLSDLDIAGTAA